MEQLIFLIVVAVISLLNWVLRKRQETGNEPPADVSERRAASAPRVPRSQQTEEERMRKFLEALGLPEASRQQTPRSPEERTMPPEIRRARQDAPHPGRPAPLRRAPPPLTREIPQPKQPPQPLPETYEETPIPEPLAAIQATKVEELEQLPDVRAYEPEEPQQPARAATRTLYEMLSSDGIRTSILLREILGPPRSLQTYRGAPNVPDL
jgi:hypothetical protein